MCKICHSFGITHKYIQKQKNNTISIQMNGLFDAIILQISSIKINLIDKQRTILIN